MKFKNILSLILVLLTVTACATANKFNSLSLGMTKKEVIEALGTPTSTAAQGGAEFLEYQLSTTDTQAYYGVTEPYYVKIVNGRVESYGRRGDFDSTKDPTVNINKTNK